MRLTLTSILGLSLGLAVAAPAEVTPPDKFFGFQLGADRKMARWDKMVDYYRLLEKEGGGRLKVVDMGPTTMGHPFLLVIISSAKNLSLAIPPIFEIFREDVCEDFVVTKEKRAAEAALLDCGVKTRSRMPGAMYTASRARDWLPLA